MLFQQSTAPVGWQKQTDNDDKALRVVSGSTTTGGSVAFSTAFASHTPAGSVATSVSGTVANHRLLLSEIPSHTHNLVLTSTDDGGFIAGAARYSSSNANTTANVSATTTPAGSGGVHNHGWSGNAQSDFTGTPIDLSVSYVDVIVAQKD